MRHLGFRAMLFPLAILALPGTASAQTRAEPTRLPLANRQLPRWDLYEALGVRTAPANTPYPDPVTGVRITKITSGSVPVANTTMFVDYAEGGPHVSREWATGWHTLLVRQAGSSTPFLVDYLRGIGTLNWRSFPPGPRPRYELTSSFSNDPQTPRLLYFVDYDADAPDPLIQNMRLYRFDTATMSVVGSVAIPGTAGVPALDPTLTKAEWLQSSKDDAMLVFQWCVDDSTTGTGGCVVKKVIAYDRVHELFREKSCLGPDPTFVCSAEGSALDEPHLERDGRYVILLDGRRDVADPNAPPTCGDFPPHPVVNNFVERFWDRWDLSTDTVDCKGGIYAAHPAAVRGHFALNDPDVTTFPNNDYVPHPDPDDDQVPQTAIFSDPGAFITDHGAGQWIQPSADPNQWYWGNSLRDGEAYVAAWKRQGGSSVYRTSIDYGPIYLKPAIGIRAVYQTASGDSTLLNRNLSPVASEAQMTEGTFHFDDGGTPGLGTDDRLYVWPHGNITLSPQDQSIQMYAPTPIHWGIGVRRLNGSDRRLLAHNYSWAFDYLETPWATTSPDGKLVVFQSNMGRRGGRTDVFVAEVPLVNVGGGASQGARTGVTVR
ncbi:MAG: hypothetical protein ACREAA_04395 [Candidatus Polarisedimenticolia bacterium]